MGNVSGAVLAVIGSIVGLAVVAVIVGSKAQTSSVISSAGTALSSIIGAAVSPVSTGNTFGAASSNTGAIA
jgi:predicted membrane protein